MTSGHAAADQSGARPYQGLGMVKRLGDFPLYPNVWLRWSVKSLSRSQPEVPPTPPGESPWRHVRWQTPGTPSRFGA
jgi:hypothetical protein